MFGLITRIRHALAERQRREKLMAAQEARIAHGFAELHTAAEHDRYTMTVDNFQTSLTVGGTLHRSKAPQ